MPTLPTQSFATIVANITAGIQGRSSALVNFTIGSVLRSIAEGFGGIFLWFQALVLQLLTAIRLSTSQGTDVDTFTADFMPIVAGSQTATLPNGSPRLGAQAASGQVTFARYTAGPSTCFIPVGTTVMTADGTQSFVVIANATYPTYTTANGGGYTLFSSIGSINVPVQAAVAGSGGNVAAGSISLITSAVTGIDTVTNVAAFTNGANSESDGALKARFSAYILGLSRGDYYGLTSSIEGVATTVQWTLTEGYNYNGSYRPGYFFVVADDGSGNPSAAFLQSITDAANAVRPLGIQCGVFGPTIIWATVSMNLTTAPGYDHNTVVAQVAAAIATNIDSLGLGNTLPFSILAGWAYAVPGVTSVAAVELNGLTGDAASLSATKLTSDGQNTISYATIKCQTTIIS